MLISAIMPMMSIYQLPLGKYACSGHVINLPQDVVSFASNLPRLPSHLDVIVVRKEISSQSHRDFRVRRAVVEQALQWLITHNIYYCANHIHINQESLAHLPQDGCLSDICSVLIDSSTVSTEPDSNGSDDLGDDLGDSQSFVPSNVPSMTEQEAVHHSVEQRQSATAPSATIMWPTIGRMPINEFTTEGYFSCAFPTLFPTGAADFSGQRHNKITSNYFKHLMMYDDGRFSKHPQFRFFALNTEMWWRALQTGWIYVKRNPGDAQLSLDELRDMVGREGEQFSKHVIHYGASLRGTKQYWFKQHSRLIAIVNTLGLPSRSSHHLLYTQCSWPSVAWAG